MIGMIVTFVVALMATLALGYQLGFRRGALYAAQRAEDEAIVTAIIRIAEDKS